MGTSMVKVRDGPGGRPGKGDCFWREEGFVTVLFVVMPVVVVVDVLGLVVVVVDVEFLSALRRCKWVYGDMLNEFEKLFLRSCALAFEG